MHSELTGKVRVACQVHQFGTSLIVHINRQLAALSDTSQNGPCLCALPTGVLFYVTCLQLWVKMSKSIHFSHLTSPSVITVEPRASLWERLIAVRNAFISDTAPFVAIFTSTFQCVSCSLRPIEAHKRDHSDRVANNGATELSWMSDPNCAFSSGLFEQPYHTPGASSFTLAATWANQSAHLSV